ncbi:MAG: protein kinase [Verrucomicrobiales bacterium]|nr:protein kinase [Verrucomicrobiales bacterium]
MNTGEAAGGKCPSCGQGVEEGAAEGLCSTCLRGLGRLFGDPSSEDDSADPPRPRADRGGVAAILGAVQPGDRIGPYKILEEIGEGGCGKVYVAEQDQPVRRRVALKVIKLGMDTREVIGRFEAERQALAMMDHPNIAKVLDAGSTESGRPYFVMEWVKGIRITDFCDSNHLSPEERLGLFIQVCQAIQHAHQKGIIHRDIKPANILVTLLDGVAVPKVIDFGIAKATGNQRLTDKTVYTAMLQFVGTPAYMSPEQAELSSLDIDTRSDIYALGVLLYELLTGSTPFDTRRLALAGIDEVRRIIREEDPPRPSTKISALAVDEQRLVAKRRQAEIPRLLGIVRGDLDWIVMKALEKDRRRRYDTATGLAADVQRYLRDEPVMARPPSRMYRLHKTWRRNKGPILAGATILAALVFGLSLAVRQARIESERNAKDQRQRRENAEAERRSSEHARQQEEHLRLRAEGETLKARRSLDALDLQKAGSQLEQGRFGEPFAHLARVLRRSPTNHVAAAMVFHWLNALGLHPEVGSPLLHGRGVHDIAFSPDGQWVVTASLDGTARVWEVAGGRPVSAPMQHKGAVMGARFSPDGRWVVTASRDGTARVWEAGTGSPLGEPLRHQSQVSSAEFSPDGRWVVTASWDSTARVWDAASAQGVGAPLRHRSTVNSAVFSPDSRRVVTASVDGTAIVWEAATGQPIGEPLQHEGSVRTAVFSPDGRLVVTASMDRTARVWEAANGRLVCEGLRHEDDVVDAEFSPDGKWVVTASGDRTARTWEVATGRPVSKSIRHMDRVNAAAFSRDGRWVVTASDDGTARIWDAASGQPASEPLRHGVQVNRAEFSPSGRWVVTAASDPSARIRDAVGRKPLSVRLRHAEDVKSAAFDPTSRAIVTASVDGTVRVWDVLGGKPVGEPLRHDRSVTSAMFSPDGLSVVTVSEDGKSRVWSIASAKVLGDPLESEGGIDGAAYSPDGGRIVTSSRTGSVQVWEAPGGKPAGEPFGHGAVVNSVRFSSNGRWIVTASDDGTARVWDAANSRLVGVPLRHEGAVNDAAFSPDNRWVVTASGDGTARVWNVADGMAVSRPLRHGDYVSSAEFSPDGRWVVTASMDRTVRLWEAATGKPIGEPLRHDRMVNRATFSPDGRWVVTASDDGAARIWESVGGRLVSGALEHGRSVKSAEFSPDGKWVLTTSDDTTVRIWRHFGDDVVGEWLADFAEVAGGLVLNEWDDYTEVTNSIVAIRVRLLAEGKPDPWNRWARWFIDDRGGRTISPWSEETVSEFVDRSLEAGDLGAILEAEALEPADGQIYAEHVLRILGARRDESDLAAADHLSQHGLRLSPRSALAHCARAEALRARGPSTQVWELLNQAILLAPVETSLVRSKIWSTILRLSRTDGGSEQGRRLVEEAVQLGLKDPKLLQVRALVMGFDEQRWDRFEDAVQAIDQGLLVPGGDPDLHSGLMGGRMVLLPDLVRRITSKQQFERLLEETFKTALECGYSSWILSTNAHEKVDREQVVLLAQKAVRLEPANPDWEVVLGAACYRAGAYSRAIEALSRAETIRSTQMKGNPSLRSAGNFFFGMSCYGMGDLTKARERYQTALEYLNETKASDESNPDDILILEGIRKEAEALPGITTR